MTPQQGEQLIELFKSKEVDGYEVVPINNYSYLNHEVLTFKDSAFKRYKGDFGHGAIKICHGEYGSHCELFLEDDSKFISTNYELCKKIINIYLESIV